LIGDGSDLIVDPGTFAYTSDPAARNRFRSARAHAVPEVDGSDEPSEGWDLFFLRQRSMVEHLSCEEVEGGAALRGVLRLPDGTAVERRIALRASPAQVRIEDAILDAKGGFHTLRARFPLAPQVDVELREESGATLRRKDRRPWEVKVVSGPPAVLSIEEGEYSETYGSKVPAPVLVVTATAKAPFALGIELRAVG
jgi:hypothetical protein